MTREQQIYALVQDYGDLPRDKQLRYLERLRQMGENKKEALKAPEKPYKEYKSQEDISQ